MNTAGERPQLGESGYLYSIRCTRCRAVQEFGDAMSMQAGMMMYYSLMDMVFCPTCSEVLTEVRLPHLQAATDAVVEEVNAYHAANPQEAPKAPVLAVVKQEE
jgi:hypothetical protein